VPFLHAGSEILRSKSGDGDSYDSGDWFNTIDWTYQTNGWGKGLPPAWRNQKEWPFWQARLTDAQFSPASDDILATMALVQKALRIRKESPLFRLKTAGEIQQSLRFLNAEAGRQQIPGLIVMHIDDPQGLDPHRQSVLVILNANPQPIRFGHGLLDQRWRDFRLVDCSQSSGAFSKGCQGLLTQPISIQTRAGTQFIPALETASVVSGEWLIPAYSVSVLER